MLKCRRFGISLNPTKIIFTVNSGKLLGHIISKDGIKIDPKRVNAIQKVDCLEAERRFNLSLEK